MEHDVSLEGFGIRFRPVRLSDLVHSVLSAADGLKARARLEPLARRAGRQVARWERAQFENAAAPSAGRLEDANERASWLPSASDKSLTCR